MPSPFPGMNPYIEQDDAWHDFHERFLPLAAERIDAEVQPNSIVKIDEHIYIHRSPKNREDFWDEPTSPSPQPTHPARDRVAAGVIEAPAHVQLPAVDVERLAFVEIRDRRSRELVTVIELLSPSNKRPGPDRDQYLSQRGQILASSAHFVEIDLLRGGALMPTVDRPICDYAVMVSRYEERPRAGLWPIGLRDRLPVIPVPLRSPDPDAQLDLQLVLDHIYDTGGYAYYIFGGEPEPPLRPDDAAWARTFLPPTP